MSEGGVTPSLGFVHGAASATRHIGLQVLVRPRGGDFVYSDAELAVMRADIAAFRGLPLPDGRTMGFTLGALTPAGRIDTRALTTLLDTCGDAPVTFHKAFDAVPDPFEALETLARLGVARVLTAAGHPTALAGIDTLAALVAAAGDRISVMAGGSVRPGNVARIVTASGVRDVHLRAPRTLPSASTTGSTAYDAGTRTVTSLDVVTEVVRALAEADR
ncbi:copper homeostasis protein CutC [Georgenia sp. TF02-10]|uniref:copper homeostasis protein CutC n=1 Tax=Georgenia sp. TF02-10 TaxID=2917725 RepID=UPI001FA6F268|nr:copper homeostasis protein CutC [Georgenia sp. TF02-10]UNX55097.1 copper homeostasis protein CutC [Georgenia sp. TF02-10]